MDKREDILKIMQALGGGPGIIALLTALSLFMSISYNIIYFFILGINIDKIPLGFSDFTISFTSWAVMLFYIILYGFFYYCIENYNERVRNGDLHIYVNNIYYVIRVILYFIFNLILITLIEYICSGFFYKSLIFFSSVLFLFFVNMSMVHKNNIALLSVFYALFIFSSLSICSLYCLMVSFCGIYKYKYNVYESVIRYFDKGVLVYNYKYEKLIFICNDKTRIEYICPNYLKIYDMKDATNEIRGSITK